MQPATEGAMPGRTELLCMPAAKLAALRRAAAERRSKTFRLMLEKTIPDAFGDDAAAEIGATLDAVDAIGDEAVVALFLSLRFQRWYAGVVKLTGPRRGDAVTGRVHATLFPRVAAAALSRHGLELPVRAGETTVRTTAAAVRFAGEFPIEVDGPTRAARNRVRRALGVLRAAWPEVVPDVVAVTERVEIKQEPFMSWSSRDLVGLSGFGDLARRVPDLARMLVHEHLHHKLHLLEQTSRIFNDPAATYTSPWKQTERPVRLILHSVASFVGELVTMRRIRERWPRRRPGDFETYEMLLRTTLQGLDILRRHRDAREGGAHPLIDDLEGELALLESR